MGFYNTLKQKIVSYRAASEKNEYVNSFYNEMIREMEVSEINSSSASTEIKGWLLRQSDGLIWQIKTSANKRLPAEESEVYLFRIACKRALAQLERDGVLNITTKEQREASNA